MQVIATEDYWENIELIESTGSVTNNCSCVSKTKIIILVGVRALELQKASFKWNEQELLRQSWRAFFESMIASVSQIIM